MDFVKVVVAVYPWGGTDQLMDEPSGKSAGRKLKTHHQSIVLLLDGQVVRHKASNCVKRRDAQTTRRSNDASTFVSVDEGAAAAFLPPIKLSLDDLVEKSVKKPNS